MNVVVEVSTQYPLFGRDWMSQLGFNVSAHIQEAYSEAVGTAECLCKMFSKTS